jgi:hypothetical protein
MFYLNYLYDTMTSMVEAYKNENILETLTFISAPLSNKQVITSV